MSSRRIHLLVLIHGMWGSPANLSALEAKIKEMHDQPNGDGEVLELLCAKTNEAGATYDGIDWGGERVADEICEKRAELEEGTDKVVKISITGYSLGGLIARYTLAILEHRHFFDDIEPINFNTIATPHVGLLKYPSLISSLMSALGPKLLSRTGEQFYCMDKWSNTERPLIEVMADPNGVFYKTLSRFKHLRLYANAVNDLTVPYCTSAIEARDPFAEHISNGIKLEMENEYDRVIASFAIPETPPPKPALLSQEWLDSMKPRPLLPPAAQFRFPFNLMIYGMLPILLVPALTYVIYRLSSETRASKDRIKKSETEESTKKRLSQIFQELEHTMENAAVEVTEESEPYPIIKAKLHPTLGDAQKRMVKWLNQLPWQKNLAFFPWVRNAHGMIICRDAHRFKQHALGESVVRHWADHFVF